MPRKKIHDTASVRRAASDADKVARGQRRITTWLSPEAVKALDTLTGGSAERGAIQNALNEALIGYVNGESRR